MVVRHLELSYCDDTEEPNVFSRHLRVLAADAPRGQMAQEWEQRGIRAVQFPQSDSRMIPASERLYDAIVHGRLGHPDDPELNAHVDAAVARHSRRGWRLDRPDRRTNIGAVVALAMAVERQAFKPEPVEVLGPL